MTTQYIMPLGFVDQSTETGGTFILANPEDSLSLRTDTHITVWRYAPDRLAVAKLRGYINAVEEDTAAFTTIAYQRDPRWPEELPVLRVAAAVYLALENTFEPDPNRPLAPDLSEALRRLALHYAALARTQRS